MAADARGGRGRELEGTLPGVTGRAVLHGMSAEQRKQRRGVGLEEPLPVVPIVRGVAGLTLEPELALVGVTVAIGARARYS